MKKKDQSINSEGKNTESNPFQRSCTRREQGPKLFRLGKTEGYISSWGFQSRTG